MKTNMCTIYMNYESKETHDNNRHSNKQTKLNRTCIIHISFKRIEECVAIY